MDILADRQVAMERPDVVVPQGLSRAPSIPGGQPVIEGCSGGPCLLAPGALDGYSPCMTAVLLHPSDVPHTESGRYRFRFVTYHVVIL